jgi:hypothetical protein
MLAAPQIALGYRGGPTSPWLCFLLNMISPATLGKNAMRAEDELQADTTCAAQRAALVWWNSPKVTAWPVFSKRIRLTFKSNFYAIL